MLTTNQLERLSELTSPLFTAYARTGSVATTLHGVTPEYMPWLKDESRAMAKSLPDVERQLFLQQAERVEEFLRHREPHERSLVVFASASVWEILPLQVDVRNEVRWGKPALAQLFWLVGEHKPCGIVTVDHAGARFFHYWLGEMVEHEGIKFAIQLAQGKAGELGHVTGPGAGETRGVPRAALGKRTDDRYEKSCRETAQQVANVFTNNGVAVVFLAGPDRLINTIAANFPRSFRQPVVLLDQTLTRLTPLELQKHLEPQIADWERKHEAELVTIVTGDERGTVLGFDEIFARLQNGMIDRLVLAQGLDAILHQCVQCGRADRFADPVCSVCGSERRKVTFRDILPELARRHKIEVNVVSGEPAERLKAAEGMVAWVRPPKSITMRSAH